MNEPLLLGVLPDVFQVSATSSLPLSALVTAADDMQAPVHAILDGIDQMVHPYRAPDALVPYLSRWVDLDWLTIPAPEATEGAALGIPVARQRDLIANAADLSARRGTPAGLTRLLQLATGVGGFEVDDAPGAFHVIVRVPQPAVDRVELVQRIVALAKPAHVTSEVVIGAVQPGSGSGG